MKLDNFSKNLIKINTYKLEIYRIEENKPNYPVVFTGTVPKRV